MRILIKNATILYTGSFRRQDILIENEKIREVREQIPTKLGVEVMDAKEWIILPGFISKAENDWQTSVQWGVTTIVKDVVGELTSGCDGAFGPLDFLYRVKLAACNRSLLERLSEDGVKLLALEQLPSDIAEWLPRFIRLGFVLDLRGKNHDISGLSEIPVLTAYPQYRKPLYARMVVRVDEAGSSSWIREWKGINRHFPPAYWLDTITTPVPVLQTAAEMKQYLFALSHFRSRIPAKLLGVFPRKGSIGIGADADLLFFQENHLLGNKASIVPEKIMVKGQFIDAVGTKHQGAQLKGNLTYAYQY